MKRFLILAVLAGGLSLAPQLAKAQDWRSSGDNWSNVGGYGGNYGGNYGGSYGGSYGGNNGGNYGGNYGGGYGGNYAPQFRQPTGGYQRVPSVGHNDYHAPQNSLRGYSNGYNFNGYSQQGFVDPYRMGRYTGRSGSYGCRSW